MTITTEDLAILDIKLITPKTHIDRRGSFRETWTQHDLERAEVHSNFVQDNHVVSHTVGTLRGLPTLAGRPSKSALDLDHRNSDDYDKRRKVRQEHPTPERIAL